jgi:hypothetical protein
VAVVSVGAVALTGLGSRSRVACSSCPTFVAPPTARPPAESRSWPNALWWTRWRSLANTLGWIHERCFVLWQ